MSKDVNDELTAKHNATLRELALLLGKDPDNFTANRYGKESAADYMDAVWARYF